EKLLNCSEMTSGVTHRFIEAKRPYGWVDVLVILFIVFALFNGKCMSQEFLNGDFEINSVSFCEFNISDLEFGNKMQHTHAFGKTYYFLKYQGEVDIQSMGCYVSPQSGRWCIGLGSDYSTYRTSDAIAMELSANLEIGKRYKLTFYIFGNTIFSDSVGGVTIGESIVKNEFGLRIDSIGPVAMNWKEINIEFQARQSSKYITLKNATGIKAWNQLDNFSISNLTSTSQVSEWEEEFDLYVYPNPSNQYAYIGLSNGVVFSKAVVRSIQGDILLETVDRVIDLLNVPQGTYIIEVQTNRGRLSKKWVKLSW
ncbi:MAG TPA: T9SS type A sorting domain-containing protein, partial [Saprospiraceae bacterium]|nr:T9SS type A sorting domain-containing protein [Saprospiraceae bacterium]